MLTHGEDVEAHALRSRGWTISAIARHLGRDRKTVRGYINGTTVPGVRAKTAPDPLEPFTKYLAARFVDDPHVWASALYDEVRRLGYPLSYPSFVRQVRMAGLRPHCEACSGVKGRDTIEIDHPPGEEIQWDWFERRNAPWGATAYVLLGTLAALGQGARRAGREDGPGPSHRGHGRGAPAPRRDAAGVADRPPGDGDRAGDARRPGLLRPGGQALSGRRRALSAPAGQPQGCGRVLGALRLGSLVAHHDGHHTTKRPSAPSTSSAPPPATSANAEDRTANAPPSASWPTPNRCSPFRPHRSRPPPRSTGSSPTTPASPFAATATRCRRDSAARPCSSGTACALRPSTWWLRRERSSSPIASLRRDRAPWCAASSTKRPSRPPCSAPSPRLVRATRRRTVRRAERRSKKRPGCSGPSGVSPSSTSRVYGEIAEGR